ncbi:glycosyltransferase family 4 protein [Methylobacterium haplocladii]|uniref:Glycosyl transferase family 1 n=1 Tax=Methylobacterium haplocladii TaxID=1176176 RepID=A0A512IVP8_9HYPH|nr:glycosyltransferase family 4 protein [Methylobacterium haplocladii]GEP01669.1 glycosyl transferase family 1 [Methylobacterium haplocladii]GJD85187.1 Glycogen synthase [Methylobacterium haplocladii]GLS59919.1 glycosyl transferase family 1 [Methylobacterium haplocladii]
MRICFVSRRYFPAISGMSVYAQNLLRELVGAGHDVTMISQYRGDAFGTRVYGGGPPPVVPGVHVIGLEQLGEQESGDFERDIATMVETICAEHAKKPFDVLHAQYGYPTGWAVLLASKRLGVPNVVSIQGGDGHWVGSCCETHRVAMCEVLAHANALLIGGQSFVKEVCDRLGSDPARFTIVPGAVDTARFTPGAPVEGEDPVRLFYHGRVDRRKGVLDMLDALERVWEAGLPFEATISGIGPDVDAARARAEQIGFTPAHVAFTGYADYETVPDLYRKADVFVSPTYAEGFSNTILEAMAAGLAVVSTHSVGVSDCLRHDENGLMVQPGDVSALAKALGRVIEDAELRARLAQAGLEECRRVYSWKAVGGQIMQVYADIVRELPHTDFSDALPHDPNCRFRAEPHLL